MLNTKSIVKSKFICPLEARTDSNSCDDWWETKDINRTYLGTMAHHNSYHHLTLDHKNSGFYLYSQWNFRKLKLHWNALKFYSYASGVFLWFCCRLQLPWPWINFHNYIASLSPHCHELTITCNDRCVLWVS